MSREERNYDRSAVWLHAHIQLLWSPHLQPQAVCEQESGNGGTCIFPLCFCIFLLALGRAHSEKASLAQDLLKAHFGSKSFLSSKLRTSLAQEAYTLRRIFVAPP